MHSSFKDKVIWITGASSGIGEALSYAFSGAGARVILSSRRADELERVRKACANPGLVRVLPDGGKLGHVSANIEKGLEPAKAAVQILRAVEKGTYESFVGRFGMEKIVLWLNRLAPGFVIKKAPGQAPK